jgi:hypothetical protein
VYISWLICVYRIPLREESLRHVLFTSPNKFEGVCEGTRKLKETEVEKGNKNHFQIMTIALLREYSLGCVPEPKQ